MGGSGGSYDPKLPFNHRAHGQRQHGNLAYSFCACNAGALLLVNRVHMAGPTGMAKRFERRQCQTHRGIQAARCSIQHGNTRVAASPVPLPPLSFYRSTNGNPPYTWPGSNWRPSACWADVIATRPQVLDISWPLTSKFPQRGVGTLNLQRQMLDTKNIIISTCGLVAMTSASHAEGRQLDPGQV